MIINLVAANVEQWEALLDGPFHDEKHRFSCPNAYDQDLVSQCGWPMLLSIPGPLPGSDGWSFHIYPPRRDEVYAEADAVVSENRRHELALAGGIGFLTWLREVAPETIKTWAETYNREMAAKEAR